MNVGKRILSIRREQNLTQEQFGELFHVTRQTVSNWEKEKSYPDLQTLIHISDRFGLSLDTLIRDDPTMVKTMDQNHKKVRLLYILLPLLLLLLLLLAIFGLIQTAFSPTPHHLRNQTSTTATMYINLPDATPSRAIVLSFDAESYQNFSTAKRYKLWDTADGQVEGDMPALHLEQEKPIVLVFQDSHRVNLEPEQPPYALVYDKNGDILWEQNLSPSEQGWKLDVLPELVPNGISTAYLEVHYASAGRNYVSLSALSLVK